LRKSGDSGGNFGEGFGVLKEMYYIIAPDRPPSGRTFNSSDIDPVVAVLPTVDCDALTGLDEVTCRISEYFSNFLQKVFSPSPQARGVLSDAFDDLKGSFPFNFFFGVTEMVSSHLLEFNEDGSGTSLVIQFPGVASTSIPLIDSDGLWLDTFGSTFENAIYNYILFFTAIFGIFGCLYIINRFSF